jgi:hypothetical protein
MVSCSRLEHDTEHMEVFTPQHHTLEDFMDSAVNFCKRHTRVGKAQDQESKEKESKTTVNTTRTANGARSSHTAPPDGLYNVTITRVKAEEERGRRRAPQLLADEENV